jgi:replicative DNA helicase
MTTPEPENPTPWQAAADEVIGACLHDRAAWELVRFGPHPLAIEHFPPGPHREAFRAIDLLYLCERPAHLVSIVNETNNAVSLEWLGARLLLGQQAAQKDRLLENCRIVQWRGQANADLTVLSEGLGLLRQARSDEDRRAVVARVVSRLSLEAGANLQDTTSQQLVTELRDLMSKPQKPGLTTAPVLMQLAGTMQRGELWLVASAYKRRKTTLMLNNVLAAIRAGVSVTVVTLETDRITMTMQLVLMLAVEWLLQNGLYHQTDPRGLPMHALSAKQLLLLRSAYRSTLAPQQVAAIDYGMQTLNGLPLRIYDTTTTGGGVRTLADVQTLLLRDRNLYGLDLLCLDYMQRLSSAGDTIYERVSRMAFDLQTMAQRHQVALMVLAQLNEYTIREGDRSYSPGVKGGGDPAAAADYLFTTQYPVEDENKVERYDRVKVTLKLARYSGSGTSEVVPIDPSSGLFLPQEKKA